MGNGPAQWATYEYQFRVVDANDPEARRTSLAPRADTVITIENVPPQPVPASSVPASKEPERVDDLYSKLIKLDDLRARGLITDSEFQLEKQKLLAK